MCPVRNAVYVGHRSDAARWATAKPPYLIAIILGIGPAEVRGIACIDAFHIAVAIGRPRILAAWLLSRLFSAIGIRSTASGLTLIALAVSFLGGRGTLSLDAGNPGDENES
jgi:hypothetical protein